MLIGAQGSAAVSCASSLGCSLSKSSPLFYIPFIAPVACCLRFVRLDGSSKACPRFRGPSNLAARLTAPPKPVPNQGAVNDAIFHRLRCFFLIYPILANKWGVKGSIPIPPRTNLLPSISNFPPPSNRAWAAHCLPRSLSRSSRCGTPHHRGRTRKALTPAFNPVFLSGTSRRLRPQRTRSLKITALGILFKLNSQTRVFLFFHVNSIWNLFALL